MPVTWSIVEDQVLVITTIGGYETSEWTARIEEACHDPRVGPITSLLFDTRSSLVYHSVDELKRRVKWFAKFCAKESFRRCALLSSPAPCRVRAIEHGVEGLRECGIETAAFTDRDAAFRWAMGSGGTP
jgi:hypothetical protein